MIERAILKKAILWQYEQAVNLVGLVELMQRGYDTLYADFWERWYHDVFNVDTANDFGLNVWARILGMRMFVVGEPVQIKDAFGFHQNDMAFDHGNFGNRGIGTDVSNLTVDNKRMAVRLRYFNLTMRPTLDNINAFLKKYLWRGNARVYCIDPQDMSEITYVFEYVPPAGLMYMIDNFDILPRPACVGVRVINTTRESFGFHSDDKAFDQGNFGNRI